MPFRTTEASTLHASTGRSCIPPLQNRTLAAKLSHRSPLAPPLRPSTCKKAIEVASFRPFSSATLPFHSVFSVNPTNAQIPLLPAFALPSVTASSIPASRSNFSLHRCLLTRPTWRTQSLRVSVPLDKRICTRPVKTVIASANDAAPIASSERSTSDSTHLSPRPRRLALAGVIFLIITYIWSFILIIPMTIAHPFVLLFDRASRRFHDVIAMMWMRLSLATVAVTPRVVNRHNVPVKGTPVVYVANHVSYLDIFVFAFLFRRIKYVSKAELFRIPVVGWAMRMAGNIALVRAARKGQMQAYRSMVSTLRTGISLVVFPEGTRSATGKLQRFKTGAFRAAKQQNVDVVPVTILGTRECMPSTAWVPLHYPREPIQLVVHPALRSSEMSLHQLAERASSAIQSALPDQAAASSSSTSARDEGASQ